MAGYSDDPNRYRRDRYHARNVDDPETRQHRTYDDASACSYDNAESHHASRTCASRDGRAQQRSVRDDASAHFRDNVGSRYMSSRDGSESRNAAGSSRRENPRNATSPYSRRNADSRYGQMERHASYGRKTLAERGADTIALHGGIASYWPLVRNVLIGVLIVLLAAAVVWYAMVSQAMRASEDVSACVSVPGIGEPYYVLLLGSDSRSEDDDVARADSIMLCRVDESQKQVTLISLPRDLLVDIEGHGSGKLNSALSYNGFSGIIDAVSDVAGVDISYYATIYFSGFEQLVDDLGGVTVDVPEGTYYDGVWVEAGEDVEINGKEALVLARCRHGNPPDTGAYAAGDYQRTANQRNLMKAIVKKLLAQPVWKLPGEVYTVAQCIETNIPAWKLAKIGLSMRGMDADGMYTACAPAYNSYIGGVSYEVLDEDEWAQMMARVEAGEDPNG